MEYPDTPDTQPDLADFHTTLVHLYRGEMNRMTVWRERLDITSNWAIVLTTALTTFTLGHRDVPHYTLLLGLAIIVISILLEGRRYRHLNHSKWRLYLLESGYFAQVLDPMPIDSAEWRTRLARDLRRTEFGISWFLSIRQRLRRNYLIMVYFVTAVWFAKLFIHPTKATSLAALYPRLSVGELIPPWFVATTAALFIVTATVLALTCPPAEQLEDWGGRSRETGGPFRPGRR